MLKFVVLAAALAIGATPVIAQAPSSGTATTAAKSQGDSDKKRCERIVEETGSRLGGRRVCKTEAEWAAERQPNREESERTQKDAKNLNGG